jgi:hypothetical protein
MIQLFFRFIVKCTVLRNVVADRHYTHENQRNRFFTTREPLLEET